LADFAEIMIRYKVAFKAPSPPDPMHFANATPRHPHSGDAMPGWKQG
jgi:hypothetical protein